jgi:uncharacterized RDD family membrane protein YckC
MRLRFQPEAAIHEQVLIDPESYDASEQQFAAGLERQEASPEPSSKFVADKVSGDGEKGLGADELLDDVNPGHSDVLAATLENEIAASKETVEVLDTIENSRSWRDEVVAKVNSYRRRRPTKAPRYPSLQLKFEACQPLWSDSTASDSSKIPPSTRHAVALNPENSLQTAIPLPGEPALPIPSRENPHDAGSNLIEFPRFAAAPPSYRDELAEPVQDRLRIIEAPELVAPPPALGGILIETAEEPVNDRRPGFEVPLQSATMTRRIVAAITDAIVVGAAGAMFGYIFFRLNSNLNFRLTIALAVLLLALLWTGYQYLLIVHAGTTPGLMLAKLSLSRFDSSPVPRRLRRWRVLASVLSGASLALGYLWCFLDEDGLCWHDRITRTYMAPRPSQRHASDAEIAQQP